MPNTYTNQSNTTPGSTLANLQKALASITTMPNMSDQDLQSGYNTSQAGALDMGAGQQDYVRQATNDLTQQSGIPQLQGQYGDLSKIFDLYLHDSNLASKYTKGTNSNAYADPTLLASSQAGGQQLAQGNVADVNAATQMATPVPNTTNASAVSTASQATNPYLASSDQIVDSAANAIQAPSLTTSMMAKPAEGATNFMNLIQSLIGTQEGLVEDQAALTAGNYQSKMNTLQKIADIMGGEMSTRRAEAKAGKNRNTAFNKNGDLVDMDTGEIIKAYEGVNNTGYQDERARRAVQSVEELMPQVSDMTVGFGSYLSSLPGTPALSFKTQLDSLKASIAFNELTAMREASKTGGALGNVSNVELGLLENALAGLDTRQSPAQFKVQLQKVKDSIERWETAASEAGVGTGSGSSSTGTVTIKNKKTGETKVIPASEKGKYGL